MATYEQITPLTAPLRQVESFDKKGLANKQTLDEQAGLVLFMLENLARRVEREGLEMSVFQWVDKKVNKFSLLIEKKEVTTVFERESK